MIEIEKNFDLRPGDKERLVKDADIIKKRVFTDIYYDSDDFRLTLKDFWLRQRDSRWELKVPLQRKDAAQRTTDQYREIEDEREIAVTIGLESKEALEVALKKQGYKPLATIVTSRESYKKGDFHLDFDEMDFGFSTFEVELMIDDEKDIPLAEQKIMDFAQKYEIVARTGPGKVVEFLYRKRPEHYQALANAGVVRKHI